MLDLIITFFYPFFISMAILICKFPLLLGSIKLQVYIYLPKYSTTQAESLKGGLQ